MPIKAVPRVDVITALKAMTIWPAWQHYEEKTKGSIEIGKLADFVIISRDPTKGDPTTIAQIKVTETIKEGTTVFKLTAMEQRKAKLMNRPGAGSGDYAFSRAMQATALTREFERLPQLMQRPAVLRHLSEMQHDPGCLSPAFAQIVASIAEGATNRQDRRD